MLKMVNLNQNEKMPVIKTADEVVKYAQKTGKEYGYENAFLELSEKSTIEFEDHHYYRMQQNYKGIPVYGRDVIYVTDEENNVTNITGNPKDVSEEFDTKPSITSRDVEQSIQEYVKKTFSYEVDFETEEINEDDLRIYDFAEDGETHLTYYVCMNGYEFLVDAHSAEVLHANSTISETTGYAASDTEHKNGFHISKTEQGLYKLADDEIQGVFDLDGKKSKTFELKTFSSQLNHENLNENQIISEDNIFGNAQGEEEYEKAVQFYTNLCKIKNTLKNENIYTPKMFVYFNDGYQWGQNAIGGVMGTLSSTGETLGIVSMGKITGIDDIDVMAHEYTHAISQALVGWNGENKESHWISEGISDIYGTILEGRYYNREPDWYIEGSNIDVKRDIKNPHMTGNAAYVNDTSVKLGEREGYYSSTVISHAAYLMWNGIDGDKESKLTSENIIKLWYRAMLMMPSDCDFITCREKVEWAALSMSELTEKQRECISDAFYKVGIPTRRNLVNYDRSVLPDSVLRVYDSERNLYSNYILDISGTASENSGLILTDVDLKDNYKFCTRVEEAEEYPLNLQEGVYIFTVTDSGDTEELYTFSVLVSEEESENTIELYTDFVSPLTVSDHDTMDNEIHETDAYEIYQAASARTTASGNWREELSGSAAVNIRSEDEREKAKVNATIEMSADVRDYDGDDLTKAKITGGANIQVAGQEVAWTVDYSNGIAHYQYTAPDQYSGDVEVDPVCFEFSSLTKDMMQEITVSDNEIQFTVAADQMTKLAEETMNMLAGMELLEYGDGNIEIMLDSKMKTIDSINMQFSASMLYQGYYADVDYDMIYRFAPAEAKEGAEETSAGIYDPIFYEYAKAISYYNYNGVAELETKYPYANEYLVTNYRADDYPICYAYYDIDGNGIDELLFSYVCIPGYEWKLVDVFTYDPVSEQIKNIGERELFSAYAGSAIYEDGIIYSSKSSQETFYRINPDGYHLDIVNQYTEIGTYPNYYYFNDTEMMDMEEFETMRNTRASQVTFNWQEYNPHEWVVAAADQSSSRPSITDYPEYDAIIWQYYQGLEAGWTIHEFGENELCYLAGYEAGSSYLREIPGVNSVGYYVTDIDNNGVEELLIGNMDKDGYSYGMFYELYTMSNGKCVFVQSSGERDRYYLCVDGSIANEGSGSAFTSNWSYYDFTENQLALRQAVFTDGYYDEQNPWFYTTTEPYADHSSPISEEEAYQTINRYQYMDIPYTALSELNF